MARRTRPLGPLGVALLLPAALALLAPVLANAQEGAADPRAPAVERGSAASAGPPAPADAPAAPPRDAVAAAPPPAPPEAPEAFAADGPLERLRGRRRWGASFAAGYAGMFVSRSFAAEHRLSARSDGLVLEGALSLQELATLRLAVGAASQTDASRRVQLTGGDLAQVVSISFAKLAAGLRTPFTTFRGAHGLGAAIGASGGYTFTRVIRSFVGCTTDCPGVTTVPLGGGVFVEPEVMLGYGEDRGVHVGVGIAYDRYLFASRLVDTVEVKLGGGF